MPTLMIVLVAAVGAGSVTPQPLPAEQNAMRAAMRDACGKLRGSAPETVTTRAAFRRCVAQIRYDGDLPQRATPRTH